MKYKNIAILGSDSLLGLAICKELESKNDVSVQPITHEDLCIFSTEGLIQKLKKHRVELVLNTHHRGGGLGFLQNFPADLFMENIGIDIHFIPCCYKAGAKKYVNILPNCVYPALLPVPYLESQIWEGLPEDTVASYSLTKKISLVQSNAFKQQYDFHSINLIVTALYGPNDNFNSEKSQVIPSMILKFDSMLKVEAATVSFWGSGNATREFIYVEDAAKGILEASNKYEHPEPMNICTGEEVRISDLALIVAEVIGYTGKIEWDTSKPEGCLRKCLSNEKMTSQLKYKTEHSLRAGIKKTVDWFNTNAKHH